MTRPWTLLAHEHIDVAPTNKQPAQANRALVFARSFWARAALTASAGVLTFLGFAGFDLWPLSFVALVPFLWALEGSRGIAQERLQRQGASRRVLWLPAIGWGGFYGWVTNLGGYYWLVEMLENFSGFPLALNIFFYAVICAYQGGQYALFGWVWVVGRHRGWNATFVTVAALAASELVYPLLFPSYYGNALHDLPALIQIADLGGPILVSALCGVINGMLFERGRALAERVRPGLASPVATAVAVAATLLYGTLRIDQVEQRIAAAPKLGVGLVQANMGIFAKREDPGEGHRRHLEQTLALEQQHRPDLVVWPESAIAFFVPEHVRNLRREVMGPVRTPLLFGGLSYRRAAGGMLRYNTAFLLDEQGDIEGTYDKTFLLAFGEYLPFGEAFPVLYDLSPNSGHFTPGDHVEPLTLGPYRITTLICYEDILPGFVREAVEVGNPHLLVNMTNDAWFGDTTEPWIHLALAKFRAVEQHRYLVRATNSGVSAIVDPLGRVMTHSGVFERATLHGEVAMVTPDTVFQAVGNWPGWVGLLAAFWAVFRRRKTDKMARK